MFQTHFLRFLSTVLLLMISVTTLSGCMTAAVATGAAAGAVLIADRRTNGAYIDDQAIELKAMSVVSNHPAGSVAHVNITSYNRMVLVSGEVPSKAAKVTIIQRIKEIENVRSVYDELVVAPSSSMGQRASDSKITANVKARLLSAKTVSANDVKVVTERSVVYLMGILTQLEADTAAQAARTTPGVTKVVRIVDYMSEDDMRLLKAKTSEQATDEHTAPK